MADDEDVTLNGKPISELRVVDLKKELDERGLSKAGTKVQLTERLKAQLLLEKRTNEAQASSGEDAKAPNLALQDDEVTGKNDFIKQYLAQQQRNLERQMQFKKKVHEEQERHSAESADESQPSATEEEVAKEVTLGGKVKVDTDAPAACGSGESEMAKSRKSRQASKEEKKETMPLAVDAGVVSEKGDADTPEPERKSTRRKRSPSTEEVAKRERHESESSSRSRSRTPEKSWSSRGRKGSSGRRGRGRGGRKESRSSSRSPSPKTPVLEKPDRGSRRRQSSQQSPPKSQSPETPSSTRRSSRRPAIQSAKVPVDRDSDADESVEMEEEEPKEKKSGKKKSGEQGEEVSETSAHRKLPASHSPRKSPVAARDSSVSNDKNTTVESKPTEELPQASESSTPEQKPARSSRWRKSRSDSKTEQPVSDAASKPDVTPEKPKEDAEPSKQDQVEKPSDISVEKPEKAESLTEKAAEKSESTKKPESVENLSVKASDKLESLEQPEEKASEKLEKEGHNVGKSSEKTEKIPEQTENVEKPSVKSPEKQEKLEKSSEKSESSRLSKRSTEGEDQKTQKQEGSSEKLGEKAEKSQERPEHAHEKTGKATDIQDQKSTTAPENLDNAQEKSKEKVSEKEGAATKKSENKKAEKDAAADSPEKIDKTEDKDKNTEAKADKRQSETDKTSCVNVQEKAETGKDTTDKEIPTPTKKSSSGEKVMEENSSNQEVGDDSKGIIAVPGKDEKTQSSTDVGDMSGKKTEITIEKSKPGSKKLSESESGEKEKTASEETHASQPGNTNLPKGKSTEGKSEVLPKAEEKEGKDVSDSARKETKDKTESRGADGKQSILQDRGAASAELPAKPARRSWGSKTKDEQHSSKPVKPDVQEPPRKDDEKEDLSKSSEKDSKAEKQLESKQKTEPVKTKETGNSLSVRYRDNADVSEKKSGEIDDEKDSGRDKGDKLETGSEKVVEEQKATVKDSLAVKMQKDNRDDTKIGGDKPEKETAASKSRRRKSRSSSSSSSDSRSGSRSSSKSKSSRSRSRSKSGSRSKSSSSSSSDSDDDPKLKLQGSVSQRKRSRESRSPSPLDRGAKTEASKAAKCVDWGKKEMDSTAKQQEAHSKRQLVKPTRLSREEKDESGKNEPSDKSERKPAQVEVRPFRRLGSNKSASSDSAKPDEPEDGDQIPKDKPARKRKWGSSKSTGNKRTSLEISTDSLKGLIDDVKLPMEPVLELEAGESMFLEPEEQQQQKPQKAPKEQQPEQQSDKRDMKIKRTVVMRDGKESEEDTRRVEPSEDIRIAKKKDSSDDENEPPSKPKAKKLKIIKKDIDTPKVVIKDSPEGKTRAEESPKIQRRMSQPLVPADEPEASNREQSPPRKPLSRIIHIINLVRPFTLGQLKQLLGRSGTLCESGFWINSIKSHCYATYEKEEQAEATRKALHGARWPQSNPKTLRVDYADKDEMDRRRAEEEGGAPPPRPPPPPAKKEPSPPAVSRDRRTSATEPEKKREDRTVREWDRGKRSRTPERGATTVTRSRSRERPRDKERERERERRHRELERSKERKEKKSAEAPKVEEEPPAKLLDDLFRKTRATPCIYWLPLTEEQSKQHQLAQQEKRKKEAQEAEQEAAARKKLMETRRDGPSPSRDRGGDRDIRGTRDRERERERNRSSQRDRERSRDNDRDRRRGGGSDSRDRGGRQERSRSRDRRRR